MKKKVNWKQVVILDLYIIIMGYVLGVLTSAHINISDWGEGTRGIISFVVGISVFFTNTSQIILSDDE